MKPPADDVGWLLWKIEDLDKHSLPNRPQRTSMKAIWMGSCDVVPTGQSYDEFNKERNERIHNRMKIAKELGLIVNETGNNTWTYQENWFLTDAGKERIGQYIQIELDDVE